MPPYPELPDKASSGNVSVVKVHSSFPFTRLNFVRNIMVNGFTVPALLDTGAETSVITYETLR